MQGVCADGSGEPRPSARRLRRSVGWESGTVWIWWPRYRFTAVGSMWWWVACSARRPVLSEQPHGWGQCVWSERLLKQRQGLWSEVLSSVSLFVGLILSYLILCGYKLLVTPLGMVRAARASPV